MNKKENKNLETKASATTKKENAGIYINALKKKRNTKYY
jgi:hypothetical protein